MIGIAAIMASNNGRMAPIMTSSGTYRMTFTLRLRWIAAILAVLALSGCESIPMPFGMSHPTNSDPSIPAPPGHNEQTKTATVSNADAQPTQQALSSELNWFPSLDKPLNQLQQDYAGLEDPARRNTTLSNIAYLYDAKLFVLFQDMLDYLNPKAQTRELKEQNDWLNKRKSLATAAFLKYEDPQQARLAAAQAFVDATKARIKVIDKRRQMVVIH